MPVLREITPQEQEIFALLQENEKLLKKPGANTGEVLRQRTELLGSLEGDALDQFVAIQLLSTFSSSQELSDHAERMDSILSISVQDAGYQLAMGYLKKIEECRTFSSSF